MSPKNYKTHKEMMDKFNEKTGRRFRVIVLPAFCCIFYFLSIAFRNLHKELT